MVPLRGETGWSKSKSAVVSRLPAQERQSARVPADQILPAPWLS